MKLTIFIFSVIVLSFTSSAVGDESICETSPLVKGKCFTVIGSFYTYSGWPPYLRIESKDKKLYGVGPVENELIPQIIYAILPTQIYGEFELCPFEYKTSVPYEEREYEMVCIKSVSNAWYWDREIKEKKKLN